MSYVFNNPIISTEPNFVVYPNALVSRGSLSGAVNPTADFANAGEVTFRWDYKPAEGNANTTDKKMLLIYNPSKKKIISLLD